MTSEIVLRSSRFFSIENGNEWISPRLVLQLRKYRPSSWAESKSSVQKFQSRHLFTGPTCAGASLLTASPAGNRFSSQSETLSPGRPRMTACLGESGSYPRWLVRICGLCAAQKHEIRRMQTAKRCIGMSRDSRRIETFQHGILPQCVDAVDAARSGSRGASGSTDSHNCLIP